MYRTMAAYARDVILTRTAQTAGKIPAQFGDPQDISRPESGSSLLKRVPANTLSSNVAGLTPAAAHRPDLPGDRDRTADRRVGAAGTLERGSLTYPQVDTTPVVAVQTSEKTEAGNTGMEICMETATASTYLGGGDLSWQAINWSTPNALDLWFRLAAADYALKTEQDAAQALQHSAFANVITTPMSGTDDFATTMTAIGAGGAEVFADSGRIANTIYMAPDRFGYLLGLTSAVSLAFARTAC